MRGISPSDREKIDEFVAGCKHECQRDAVAVGEIAQFGSQQLSLSGKELETFIGYVAKLLLDFGCKVVISNPNSALVFDWVIARDFLQESKAEVLESLMKYRKESDDGYGFYACFALPVRLNGESRI